MSAQTEPSPLTVLPILDGHIESPIAPAPFDRVRLAVLYRTLAGRHPKRQYVTASQVQVGDPIEFVADDGTTPRRWAGVVVALTAVSVTVYHCRNDEDAWSYAATIAARNRPVYDPWASLDEEETAPPASGTASENQKTSAIRPSYPRRQA